MSNRVPSMNTVHPSVDPRGGIYPAEIDRLKNKIKLGDKISVNTEKGYVNINQDSTKPGIAQRRGTVIAKRRHLRKSMGMICGCRSLGKIIWRSKQCLSGIENL